MFLLQSPLLHHFFTTAAHSVDERHFVQKRRDVGASDEVFGVSTTRGCAMGLDSIALRGERWYAQSRGDSFGKARVTVRQE